MEIVPTDLQRLEDGSLEIRFSDGARRVYTPAALRAACPCATCREKKSGKKKASLSLPVLTLEEARPVTVSSMRPVGNYAYNIVFSDGHDSGIFTFDYLYNLGTMAESK